MDRKLGEVMLVLDQVFSNLSLHCSGLEDLLHRLPLYLQHNENVSVSLCSLDLLVLVQQAYKDPFCSSTLKSIMA